MNASNLSGECHKFKIVICCVCSVEFCHSKVADLGNSMRYIMKVVEFQLKLATGNVSATFLSILVLFLSYLIRTSHELPVLEKP